MSSENEELAGSLCAHLGKLKSDRGVLDSHLQEVTERVAPHYATFTTKDIVKGAKKTDKVFDSTASIAAGRFASVLDSFLTPQGQKWHGLSSTDPSLNKILRVREYYEEVTRILFANRYSPRANFANQQHETYYGLGVLGTGLMLTEPLSGGGCWYRSLPLSRTWVSNNNQGVVDTVFREFTFTVKQAIQQWGNDVPACVMQAKDKPEQEFDFVQAIMPNQGIDVGRADYMGMEYSSVYFCTAQKDHIISRGGYHTFPIAVSRYATAVGETYGRSPAMTVLPDIKMLNEMEKTIINAAHLAVQPPWLIADDLIGNPVSFKPGVLNRGAVNSQGQALVQPMVTGGRHDIGFDMTKQKREVIGDAFLMTLFQLLRDSPGRVTATEIIEKSREKGILIAPTLARQESELIAPEIMREIDILARQGRLPPMPPELIEAEGEYKIIYDSPLSRAQRGEEISGFTRALEILTPIYQIDQNIFRKFDFDKIVEGITEISGAPARWMKSDEQVAQEIAAQQAQQQAAQLLEAAPIMAKSQLDVQRAQAIAQSGTAGRV